MTIEIIKRILFCVVLCTQFLPRANAVGIDDTVVLIQHDIHIGWDSGTLKIEIPGHSMDQLIVEFNAEKRGKISYFLIKANVWWLDLTELVSQLPEPFPTRIAIKIFEWSDHGYKSELAIDIPFIAGDISQGLEKCQSLSLEIKDGKLVRKGIGDSGESRCMY